MTAIELTGSKVDGVPDPLGAVDDVRVVADPPRRRLRVLLAALLVAVTGGALGGFHAAAYDTPQPSRYDVPMGDARWVTVPGAGSTAWYGTAVDLPQAAFTATLWIQADQAFQIYVNGRRGPSNATEVRASAPQSLHAIDVLTGLRTGSNGIVVAVTNADGGSPALIARLDIVLRDGSRLESASGGSSWTATGDAAQVGAELPAGSTRRAGQEQLLPSGPGSKWTAPDILRDHLTAGSALPAWPLDAPISGIVLTGASSSSEGPTLSSTFSLPADPDTGWLRVAATSSFDVVVNGTSLGTVVPNPMRDPARSYLYLFDVSRLAHSGENSLVVQVHGAGAAAAVDGELTTPGGTVSLASSKGWTAAGQTDVVSASTAQEAWPRGLVRLAVPPVGLSMANGAAQVVVGALLILALWWGLAVGASRVGTRPARDSAATTLAVATAPTLALSALLALLSTWSTRSSAFPLSESGWWLCVVVLVASLAVTALLLTRAGRQPDEAASGDADGPPVIAATDHESDAPAETHDSTYDEAPEHRRWSWSTWTVLGVAAVATLVQAFGLGHDPLWQDEATSLVVADSIRDHVLPLLPSDLFYFKGELYHALLAGATFVTDNVTALRAISLAWFFATVVAFGLMLIPALAPGRRVVQVTGVLLFALAPAEVVWATQIRMYQQAQFFTVLFFALFLTALLKGGQARIVGSALALLAMYLSHEESFIILPAIPVLLAIQWRSGWWRARAWWISFGLVGIVIAAQYILTKIHPPTFGADLSNVSYIGWDPQQSTFYYNQVFFAHIGTASLALMSALALLASVVGVIRRDRARILIGVALLVSVLSVSLVFTVKIERYTFVLLPLLFALGVLGGADVLGWLRALAGRPVARTALVSTLVSVTGVLGVCALLASMAQSPRDFSLLASRVTGSTTTTRYVDYSVATSFVQTHRKPGDVVITLAPPSLPARYLGQAPDAIIQTGRNKMLYLIENGGRATDTIFGTPTILDGNDLAAYLAQHRRVWLISDRGGYLQSVPADLRAELLRGFTLVHAGSGSTVWLWSS